jgi:predicted MFS family arabinose efflux permease
MMTHLLLQNANYRKLWLAFAVAMFSGYVAMIAFPLVAIKHLNASDWEMGLLIGVEVMPFLLFSLPAGTWVDRLNVKKLLAACFGALVLVTMLVPSAFLLGWLSMPVLYVAGFLMGTALCIEGVASQVFTTELVGRGRLVEANAWLMGAESGNKLLAPAVGGVLVEQFGAPKTLWIECALLSVATLLLLSIKPTRERTKAAPAPMWPMIQEGLSAVYRNPILRSAAVLMVVWQFLWHGVYALIVLHGTRDVGLSPSQLGLAMALGAAGILAATVAAKRVEQRYGLGAGTLAGFIITSIGWAVMAFAPFAPKGSGFIAFALAYMVMDFGLTLGFVCYTSLRQAVTSDALLGRVVATMRWLSLLLAPLGSVVFGAFAHHASTAWAIGTAAAVSALICSAACFTALARVKSATQPHGSSIAIKEQPTTA